VNKPHSSPHRAVVVTSTIRMISRSFFVNSQSSDAEVRGEEFLTLRLPSGWNVVRRSRRSRIRSETCSFVGSA
jgi:hypothetical protein